MPYACTVVDDNTCEGQTNMECFACGEPVCGACSVKVAWYNYGIRRIGIDCAREGEVIAQENGIVIDISEV